MASIRVTPETLNTQGTELIAYADDLVEILGSVKTKIDEIIEGWDGLAQGAYYDMYLSMNESLVQFPDLVRAIGSATTSAAEAYSNVDSTLQQEFNKISQ